MPDWTDYDRHDPGVTLLQLLPWLAVCLLVAAGVVAYRRHRGRLRGCGETAGADPGGGG